MYPFHFTTPYVSLLVAVSSIAAVHVVDLC